MKLLMNIFQMSRECPPQSELVRETAVVIAPRLVAEQHFYLIASGKRLKYPVCFFFAFREDGDRNVIAYNQFVPWRFQCGFFCDHPFFFGNLPGGNFYAWLYPPIKINPQLNYF